MARQAKIKLSIHDVNVGDVYGRLTVTSVSPFLREGDKQIRSIALCNCSCGNDFELPTRRLRDVRSCGCIRKEKWHHKSKAKDSVYSLWNTIKTRCYCETHKQFSDYGGRGIKMCLGIKNDFLHFEKIMGERPSPKHSTERVDNDFHYCCGECQYCITNKWDKNIRWATAKEQASNKRTNLYLIYNGEKLCLAEVSRRCGIPQPVLHQRITQLKWTTDEATSIPIGGRNNRTQDKKITRNQYSL